MLLALTPPPKTNTENSHFQGSCHGARGGGGATVAREGGRGSTKHNLTTAGGRQTPPKCCEGSQRTGHSHSHHSHSHSHSNTSAGCTASRDHKAHPATGGQTKPTVSKNCAGSIHFYKTCAHCQPRYLILHPGPEEPLQQQCGPALKNLIVSHSAPGRSQNRTAARQTPRHYNPVTTHGDRARQDTASAWDLLPALRISTAILHRPGTDIGCCSHSCICRHSLHCSLCSILLIPCGPQPAHSVVPVRTGGSRGCATIADNLVL